MINGQHRPSGPGHPPAPPHDHISNGYPVGAIRPGQRMPTPGQGMRPPGPAPGTGGGGGGPQPGQLFVMPGYTGANNRPMQNGTRATSNPIRPGLMQQPGPPPMQAPHAVGPYPSAHPPPMNNYHRSSPMPQPRNVSAPLPRGTAIAAAAPYGRSSGQSHLSTSSGASGSTHSHMSRHEQRSPPVPLPTGPILTPEPRVVRTPPPLDDARHSTRSDQSASTQGRRSDSVSSSALGGNGFGVSANGGGSGRNPMSDLVESEKLFVERMGLVVRKVAGAYSRSNLPPPALDSMFRAMEAVYKCSRTFATRLEEIGLNPSSPKILGNLLIQWIDDLSGPYESYSNALMMNFDRHPAIAQNPNLPRILQELTLSHPPPLTSSSPLGLPHKEHPAWSVDLFFILPLDRLHFYRKLYDKLLKSTREGKSDWRLLKRSCERLEVMVEGVEERLGKDVNVEEINRQNQEPMDEKALLKRAMNSQKELPHLTITDNNYSSSPSLHTHQQTYPPEKVPLHPIDVEVTVPPNVHGSLRTLTPVERPSQTPLTDLEVRLDTSRTIDLFTMKTKQCRLQMAPPTLAFTREQKRAADCEISFTPTCTRQEVVHERAQILILSDLFLMCEHMSATEKAQKAEEVLSKYPERAGDGSPFPEMWLCYPPLAGRHLSAVTGGVETELVVGVMGKEKFSLTFESREVRDEVLADMNVCIEFASKVGKSSRSANNSPQIPTGRQPDGSPSLQSLGPALPAVPRKQSMPVPRIPTENLYAPPPPRGASLRTPPPDHHHQYLPAPSSAPLPPQSHSMIHPESRSDDGHGRPTFVTPQLMQYQPVQSQQPQAPPPPPSNHDYMRQLRQAHPVDGSGSLPRPSLPNVNIPSPIERGGYEDDDGDDSPVSPVAPNNARDGGHVVVSAQMKCKVFLKQSHQQWKALGSARLKLYVQTSTNIKQLVVESENKDKTMLISTIVLTDGVERVAKTGVAVEISDLQGARTGIINMIQLRNEDSAQGLFTSLIAGSDRARRQ